MADEGVVQSVFGYMFVFHIVPTNGKKPIGISRIEFSEGLFVPVFASINPYHAIFNKKYPFGIRVGLCGKTARFNIFLYGDTKSL